MWFGVWLFYFWGCSPTPRLPVLFQKGKAEEGSAVGRCPVDRGVMLPRGGDAPPEPRELLPREGRCSPGGGGRCFGEPGRMLQGSGGDALGGRCSGRWGWGGLAASPRNALKRGEPLQRGSRWGKFGSLPLNKNCNPTSLTRKWVSKSSGVLGT